MIVILILIRYLSFYPMNSLFCLNLGNFLWTGHDDRPCDTSGLAGRAFTFPQPLNAHIAFNHFADVVKMGSSVRADPKTKLASYAFLPVHENHVHFGIPKNRRDRASLKARRILTMHAGEGLEELEHPIPLNHRTIFMDMDWA
jgi:hypothetical protein